MTSDSPAPDSPAPDGRARCHWPGMERDELYRNYHDAEWGRPVTGESELFERLSLEAFQSGLSWLTILRKREAFRAAFHGFDPVAVAAFDAVDVARLLADAAIVRNRRKITATIANARALLELPQGITLASLLRDHAPTTPRAAHEAIPTQTPASRQLAAALKSVGFSFVGPTTAYAMMAAVGLVNDHEPQCWLAPADRGPNSPASPGGRQGG